MRGKLPKRQKVVKRQREYHSSSEDEASEGGLDAPQGFAPVNLEGDDEVEQKPAKPGPKFSAQIATTKPKAKPILKRPTRENDERSTPESEDDLEEEEEAEDDVDDSGTDASGASEGSEISETSTNNPRRVRKRNDPDAFATSISKILGTKLTSQKRSEPILSRSKSAQETNKSLSDHKLTLKAHRALLADKKAAQEKGRVKDVLGLDEADVSTADIVAKEKQLRRTAQKGVIKLFNAVRAAQVKGELAEKEARQQGVVGMAKREEKVKEMSKQGFLDMIAGGGKKKEGSVEVQRGISASGCGPRPDGKK